MFRSVKKKINRISEHFTKSEFKCHCGCGQCIVDPELVVQLEFVREKTGLPVIMHCVNRCESHNAKVGGVKNSQHVTGKAGDFHIKGMSIKQLHEFIKHNHKKNGILNGGAGYYDWGVHLDSSRFRTWGK